MEMLSFATLGFKLGYRNSGKHFALAVGGHTIWNGSVRRGL